MFKISQIENYLNIKKLTNKLYDSANYHYFFTDLYCNLYALKIATIAYLVYINLTI